MGKGSKAPTTPTEQNITQTSLPDYYEPYALRLMDRAEGLSLGNYQPYGGQRTADISSDTGAAYDLTRQVAGAGVPGLDTAFDVTQQNMRAGQDLANVQPYQFGASQFQASGANPYMGFQSAAGYADPYAGFQGTQFDQFGGFQSAAGGASPYDLGAERQFTGQEVQQYMDPYLENVVDVQKREAEKDYQRAQAGRSAEAVQAGAFGGSRSAVREGLAESEMLDRMARIDAEGRSAAFGQAATQFGQDRSAQQSQREAQAAEMARVQGIGIGEAARVQSAMADEQYRIQNANASEFARIQESQAAEMARVQGISIEEAARVQAANAAERARVEGSQADENARARDQSLAALGFSSDQAKQLSALGEMARAGDIQAAQLLETIGRQQEAYQQQGLDVAYQDFLGQRDFQKDQLNYLSGIMRGVPVQPNTSTSTMQPTPSMLQQALGGGLGAVGLYRGLTA